MLMFILVACQASPVILVATPIPADSSYHTYHHPSGAFTIRLPADWSIRDVSSGEAVRVEFSPPGNQGLPLTVYVVNTGKVLDAGALLNAINTYQAAVNGDAAVYHELSRNAQGDGSWRLIGIRQTPIGPRQLNTFLQADKAFLSALEADITDADETRLSQLRSIINTYRADPTVTLTAAHIEALPGVGVNTSSGTLSFGGLLSWTDSEGAFNINGELTNNSSDGLEAVRVTAQMVDAKGDVIAEQGDVIDARVLAAGEAAPFSIRFRNGKPSGAVRYELQASARGAQYNLSGYLGPDSFLKGNEIANYDRSGYFVVSGDVVNQIKQPAHAVRVTVTVYDAEQRVVASQSEFVEKSDLLPGESSHYAVTFYQLAGNAARFVTKIDGQSGS